MASKSKPKLDKCLTPGCDREQRMRGVCLACYQESRRQINSGEFTDAQLVQLGLIRPSQRGKRPDASPFKMQLAKATAATKKRKAKSCTNT